MPSTYSTNLALELIGTGDQAGVWGNTTNTNLGTLIEQAISGYVTQAVSTGADTTITIPNGATGVARNMYIELTGTGGTNTNLIVPSNKKLYFIFNNTSSGQVTVKVSGQTGVSVPQGKKVVLVSNGTDIVNGLNYIADFGTNSFTVTNLTATSATITTLTGTSAGITTISSGSANITQLQSTSATITTLTGTSANIATLSGTTATFTSATVTNLALTSVTLSNLNIASANITTLTSSSATISTTLALSGGTANGVLYLNGSKVATSGSALTFDGTNLALTTVNSIYRVPTAGGYLFDAGGNNGIYILGSSNYVATYTGGSEQMRLNSTGLGIGTSSPTTRLTVSGTTTVNTAADATAGLVVKTFGTAGGTQPIVNFQRSDAAINFQIGYNGNNGDTYLGTTTNHNLLLITNNSTKATLDSSGNLGIGTSSPEERLHVVGASNTSTTVQISSANTGYAPILNFDGVVGAAADNLLGLVNASWDTHTNVVSSIRFESGADTTNKDDGLISFWTSASGPTLQERMRLDSSGNLGLGVTPSAWGNGASLQGNAWAISTTTGFDASAFSTNTRQTAYGNISENVVYRGTAAAMAYEQIAGQHRWFTAPSGTAGNTISFTQAMTLDADGDLGVGETAPDSKLHVKANGRIARFAASTGTDSAYLAFSNTGGNYFIGADNSAGNALLTTGGAAYGFTIVAETADPIVFGTNNTERARITSGGYSKFSNDGTYYGPTGSYHEFISTSSGENILRLDNEGSPSPYGIEINFSGASPDNNTQWFLRCADSTTTRCYIWSDGDLANHDGVYGTISDERLKQDIVDAPSQWDDLKAVRFRKYRMKSDVAADPNAPSMLGVVAQELEQVCPGLVEEHPDMEMVEVTDEEGNVTQTQQPTGTTTKTVKSSILLMKAAVALQEAMARIEKLEAEMAALKGA